MRVLVKQVESERIGVTPKSKALSVAQQRIPELEAKVNRLKREKSILKEATALFMSDDLNSTR